jgi:hypothetical protein
VERLNADDTQEARESMRAVVGYLHELPDRGDR